MTGSDPVGEGGNYLLWAIEVVIWAWLSFFQASNLRCAMGISTKIWTMANARMMMARKAKYF